jgi:hypothetical protein
MSEYREFWNEIYFGTKYGFAGTADVTEYWLRVCLVVAVCLLAGVASMRFASLPVAVTILGIGLWALSVAPFLVWAAGCGGCGSAASYDSARSYEAMQINQWWGGLLAMGVASVWVGVWLSRKLR